MGGNYNPTPVAQTLQHTHDTTRQKQWQYAHPSTRTKQHADNINQKYQVYTDGYTKMTRLDLYKFDGSPMNPMFLAYSPPLMLPTVTMNPTTTATSAAAKSKRTAGAAEPAPEALNKDAKHVKRDELAFLQRMDLNILWWGGVGMVVFGGTAYLL